MSEDPETPKASNGRTPLLGKFAKIVLIALVLFFLMGFVVSAWPLEIFLHFIFGSFIHAWKNLPLFFSHWRAALLPLACLAVAVLLAQRFIRWWITNKEINMSWRAGHSAAAALLILLGSAAAIAMSGITHQAAWLVSSPWLETNRRVRSALAVSNARQILLVIFEFEIHHNRYPDTLEEALKAVDGLPRRVLWVETGPDKLREPFILLKPRRPSSDVIEPVLLSPVIQPGDSVVVGYSDGSVRSMPLKEWQKLVKEIQSADE